MTGRAATALEQHILKAAVTQDVLDLELRTGCMWRLTFAMRGMTRLAGVRPLDGRGGVTFAGHCQSIAQRLATNRWLGCALCRYFECAAQLPSARNSELEGCCSFDLLPNNLEALQIL